MHHLDRRLALPLAAIIVATAACGDDQGRVAPRDAGPRDGGPDGGFVVRDASTPRPPPDTIVPCRVIGDARTVTGGVGSGTLRASVGPGAFGDEIGIAYPRGESGADRVTVERVDSDGDGLDPPSFATPSHPRTASPALVETPAGSVLFYLHDGFPPLRAYAVVRTGPTADWSDPIPLSDGFREVRRIVAVPIDGEAALVAFREVDLGGEEDARILLGRVEPDGTVTRRPELVEGLNGANVLALASRRSEATLVVDLPSATGDGRDLVARQVDRNGVVASSPVIVASDRRPSGDASVLRLAPDRDGSSDDVQLVAWSELPDGGVVPDIHLARLAPDPFEDVITSGPDTGSAPTLAPLFDDWFVLSWRVDPTTEDEPGTVRMRVGRPFRTGGLAVRDVFPIGGAQSGALATGSSGDAYAVGVSWTESGPSGFRTVYGTARCTDRTP